MQLRTRLLALVALGALSMQRAHAQGAPDRLASLRCGTGVVAVELPGGLADETRRARGIRTGARYSLARRMGDSARAAMRADTSGRVRLALVAPEILATTQERFPLPANDGPMWAGRGLTRSITAGVALCGPRGRWGAIIAPTFWRAANADFPLVDNPQIVPPFKPDANPFSSPYHYDPRSLDQPRRFGPHGYGRLDPGVLAAWWRGDAVEVGVTTEPEWWGPGLRNALLLSTQAAGVPRAYVRSSRPLSLAGSIEYAVFLGGLSWSPYWRITTPSDTARGLTGAMIAWRPWFDRGLQFGVARLVASPVQGGRWLQELLNPVRRVGRPNAINRFDSTSVRGLDQLFSVFAHWRLPDDGTEAWLEWGRAEEPENLADLLRAPNHSQAMTIGIMHVRPFVRPGWAWRIAGEYTQTNQVGSFRERPSGSWYVSRAVPGGFTQRGQVLGAAIGSGSVSQWAAFDVTTARSSGGVFLQRVKWDDDSFFTIPRPLGNGLCKHDVSLSYGVRGSLDSKVGWFDFTVANQRRLNVFWQALGFCFANEELQLDARNVSVELRFRAPFPGGAPR